MMLVACTADDELRPTEQHAIAFTSVTAEQEAVTRGGEGGATRAVTNLGRDFIVYGYKNVGSGQEQVVFDGYAVKYKEGSANTSEDNTHGYYYVGGSQSIKYWDYSASEYHFFGYYAIDPSRATYTPGTDTSPNKLTLDVQMRVGDAPSFEDDLLYSELAVRQPRHPVSSDAVRLTFKRPYAKVRIQFYTNEPINDPLDNVNITNISFGPDPTAESPLVNKIYNRGDMVISYPKSTDNCTGSAKDSYDLDHLRDPQDALLFDNVTLTSTLGISSNTAVTAPIDETNGFRLGGMPGSPLKAKRKAAASASQQPMASAAPDSHSLAGSSSSTTRAGEQPGRNYFYYPLPMGEKNPAFIMTANVDADIDATPRTAVVPANFMQWKPNFFYTYIFKITGGGNIEFYDVQIEPWHYGGSQKEEWKNW